MKEKPDVLQGTLALMVLKTLDVLGPQHGWGIARRIEQISGDLLAVNQGTLYPCCSSSSMKVRLPRSGAHRKTTAARASIGLPRPAASNSRRRPAIGSKPRRSSRAFSKSRRRICREILATLPDSPVEFRDSAECRPTPAGRDRRTSCVPNRRESARRNVARRSAASGRNQVRCGGSDPRAPPRRAKPSIHRESALRPALRGSHASEISWILFHCDRHHGAGHRSHHRDL